MATHAASALADDVEIVRRLLAHIDAGSTDCGEVWREPVDHYVDPSRFASELALLRSMPSVFVPSASVASPGDHVERVAFSVPLFAVRDRAMTVRVFRNACRHRGVSLVNGRGCAQSLVCGYHGWTYRLDGTLAHVPHADGFVDLDTATRGLVEVASREIDGLIWINPVEPHTTGPSVTAPLTEFDGAENGIGGGGAWRDKLVPASQCIATSTVTRALNWKIAVEQFLEGYHIRSTHRETFFPLQYDNLNIVETFGPNSRITYPYRNIERLRERPTDTWRVKRRVTFVYQLFPNVMVATFPDRVSVIVVDPVDVGHCTLTTFTLTDPTDTPTRAITDDKQSAVMSRRSSGETLINAGTIEDNAMSLAVQRGLQAGANEYVEFGRHESAIGHFHRHLDARLTGASAASAASAASQ